MAARADEAACSEGRWRGWLESNQRPLASEANPRSAGYGSFCL